MSKLNHDYSKGVPFDLHEHYNQDAKCGYSTNVQRAARLVRGINACAQVLATERPETLKLGGYVRGGLIEAIDELAFAVTCELDALSDALEPKH